MALRQRVLTAVVLLPLVILVVMLSPSWLMGLLAAAAMLGGAWEWCALCGVTARTQKAAYLVVVAALIAVMWYAVHMTAVLDWILGLALIWWLLNLAWFTRGVILSPATKRLAGLFTLVPAWTAIYALHTSTPDGPHYLMFLFVLVWAADVGAYFAGQMFGRVKLAPTISPGKTWEGVLGGLALSTVVAVGGAIWFGQPLTTFLWLCLGVVGFSIVGDLSESFFKRQAGLKDSGDVLPGHGGILDRMDSFYAASPVFVLGLRLTGQ